jgi:hypothetical protein
MAYLYKGYWYKSERQGRRVVTKYLGSGEFGRGLAELHTMGIRAREQQRAAMQAEREAQRAIDARVDAVGDAVRVLVRAVLVANGYYTHKGQWRKRGHDSD